MGGQVGRPQSTQFERARQGVKKTSALKLLNPLVAFLLVGQAVSGIAHDVFQQWSYSTWRLTHTVNGYALVGAVALHVWLNWAWVKTTLLGGRRPGDRALPSGAVASAKGSIHTL